MANDNCKCPRRNGTSSKKKKIFKAILLIFAILIIVVLIGFIGYKLLFRMSSLDAWFNTTITASTLGIDPHERTSAEKIFTGLYAVFAGIFFVAVPSAIVSYIFALYYIGDE